MPISLPFKENGATIRENPSWGYDRIVGALANLGPRISDQTVGNILKRHGLRTAPEGKRSITWAEFIRCHKDVLWATASSPPKSGPAPV